MIGGVYHLVQAAIVSITAPAGFATPSTMQQILTTVPGITLSLKPVGKDLQTPMTFRLSAPAPAGGMAVTIKSADPGVGVSGGAGKQFAVYLGIFYGND
jgi:hypothetical protein